MSEQDESLSLQLASIDGSRLGENSEIVITIADDENNRAPSITLHEHFEVNTNQYIVLTAEVIDLEGDTMSYLWQKTSGDNLTLSNENTLSTSFVAPSTAGELTFVFTATDFRAASNEKSITVTVVSPPVEPAKIDSGGVFIWLFLLMLPIALRKIMVSK